MNGTKFSVAAGLLVAVAFIAQALEKTDDEVADAMITIQRANSDWSRAMKSADADVIAEPYAVNGVFITADGDSVRGRMAIRDLYRARLSGKAKVVSATIEHRGTARGDDGLVFEWGVGTVTSRSAAGDLDTRGGPYLTVWRRGENRKWEIIRNVVLQSVPKRSAALGEHRGLQAEVGAPTQLATRSFRGNQTVFLGDVEYAEMFCLDRQKRSAGCGVDMNGQGTALRRVPGAGSIELPVAQDQSFQRRRAQRQLLQRDDAGYAGCRRPIRIAVKRVIFAMRLRTGGV